MSLPGNLILHESSCELAIRVIDPLRVFVLPDVLEEPTDYAGDGKLLGGQRPGASRLRSAL